MIIFLLLVAFAAFMLLFGMRLLSDCADLDADLSDYVWALDALVAATILGTEAYYRCPFKLVWI